MIFENLLNSRNWPLAGITWTISLTLYCPLIVPKQSFKGPQNTRCTEEDCYPI